jgi:hypothetical protein
MKITYITGFAYSGKTTYAKYLLLKDIQYGKMSLIYPMASGIKYFFYKYFGLSKMGLLSADNRYSSLNTQKLMNMILDYFNSLDIEIIQEDLEKIKTVIEELCYHIDNCLTNNDYNYSFRKCMQLFGTEVGRNLDNDIWIKLYWNRIKKLKNIDNIYIDDWRFPNEYLGMADLVNADTYLDNYDKLDLEFETIFIYCPIETRMERSGLTSEQLKDMSLHDSEKYINQLHDMCQIKIDSKEVKLC